MSVVGDYIFRATFDIDVNKKVETQIHKIKKLSVSEAELQSMQEIVNMQGKFTLCIENNGKKANKYRNKLKKYFVN